MKCFIIAIIFSYLMFAYKPAQTVHTVSIKNIFAKGCFDITLGRDV